MFSAGLQKRPRSHLLQQHHPPPLALRLSSTQSTPPGILLPNPQRAASQRWWSQRLYCHLRGVLGEGSYPLVICLLCTRMIGEIIRSQAPNKVAWAPPSPSRLSQTATESVLSEQSSPSSAPVLSLLPRLGQRPYMIRLPLRRPHCGISLQLPHTSTGPWPREICEWHPSRSLSSWWSCRSLAICSQSRSILTPSLLNLYSQGSFSSS